MWVEPLGTRPMLGPWRDGATGKRNKRRDSGLACTSRWQTVLSRNSRCCERGVRGYEAWRSLLLGRALHQQTNATSEVDSTQSQNSSDSTGPGVPLLAVAIGVAQQLNAKMLFL